MSADHLNIKLILQLLLAVIKRALRVEFRAIGSLSLGCGLMKAPATSPQPRAELE